MPKPPRPNKEKKERKGKPAASTGQPTSPSAGDTIRRRRNKRLLFVGTIAILVPVFELVSYQFRAITITVNNRSASPITKLKVIYPGGEFEAPEVKAGGRYSQVIRPDYTFTRDKFSAYLLTLRFSDAAGGFYRQNQRINSLDYSARETFDLLLAPPAGPVELKHSSQPGFPLGTIRDLLASLGL